MTMGATWPVTCRGLVSGSPQPSLECYTCWLFLFHTVGLLPIPHTAVLKHNPLCSFKFGFLTSDPFVFLSSW